MADVLDRLPDEVANGTQVLVDYTADETTITTANGWAVALEFLKDDGTAAGTESLTNTTGSTWRLDWNPTVATGRWRFQVRATKAATPNVDLARGLVTILADYGTAADVRTHARKMLDAIEATMESKATKDQLAYTIGGRTLQKLTPEQLMGWRNYYRNEVQQETDRDRRQRGLGTGAKILTRW